VLKVKGTFESNYSLQVTAKPLRDFASLAALGAPELWR
jgi:hypothetical protein